jgi:3-oxoacyl-[acyl-carrier protein] reductase
MSKISLAGKTALVTGGGTGIGRAIALEFAKNGATVVVNYNASKEAAEEVVAEIEAIGGKALALQADLIKEDQVEKLVKETVAFAGTIDILVNNAGTLVKRCPIDQMDLELYQYIMDVNVTSTFLMCKHVIPIMKAQQGGKIINMSSVAAHNGGGNGAVIYATSKAAVTTFTKGLAKELAPYNILVNSIAPGVITTRFHDQYTSAEARENFRKSIPLGREGAPEEVAGAAMLLATEYGSYITGEMIEVNGGMYMD